MTVIDVADDVPLEFCAVTVIEYSVPAMSDERLRVVAGALPPLRDDPDTVTVVVLTPLEYAIIYLEAVPVPIFAAADHESAMLV